MQNYSLNVCLDLGCLFGLLGAWLVVSTSSVAHLPTPLCMVLMILQAMLHINAPSGSTRSVFHKTILTIAWLLLYYNLQCDLILENPPCSVSHQLSTHKIH